MGRRRRRRGRGWRPTTRASRTPTPCSGRRAVEHLFGTDAFGRDVLSRVIAGARPVLIVAPLAVAARRRRRHRHRARHRLPRRVPRHHRRCASWRRSPSCRRCSRRCSRWPLLGRSTVVLVVVIAFAFIADRHVDGAVGDARRAGEAATSRPPGCAVNGRRGSPGARSCPTSPARSSSRRTVRLADAVFAIATLSFLGLGAPPGLAGLGRPGRRQPRQPPDRRGGPWCSRRSPSPAW